MATPITLNYTAIDYDAITNELITYFKETKTFKDVDYESSNIKTLLGMYSWLGANFGYYINAVANEPFLPTAKRYKNLNRIAKLLAYNPVGYRSSTVDVVGSLDPEYCYGKEDSYFEIPSYSAFPSNKSTPNGQNFSFTNQNSIVYMIKGFGVKKVEQSDFIYDGNQFPYTAPKSYWKSEGTTGTSVSFNPQNIELSLSDNMPLSVLNRVDQSNYKGFDSSNVPLFNPSDSTSVGQPFVRNITMKGTTLRIQPDITYCIVFVYDSEQSMPFLEIYDENNIPSEKRDNIINTIRLIKEDADGNFWTLKETQNNALGKFYKGVLGLQNLDSVSFTYDKLEAVENGVKQLHIDINKSGDKSPFNVLINGIIYSFKSGRISSQTFETNMWDVNQPYYNVNMVIISPDQPDYNYDATLNITAQEPASVNEVTIARIYPSYVDSETDTETVKRIAGQRFGNFQMVPELTIETTEQKTGSISFSDGINKIFVSFDTPFTQGASATAEYAISLTPSENVQIWYSDKNEDGFSINVESDTGFDGTIDWIATKINISETKDISVIFDEEIPQIDNQDVDYTIFLTPSDNVVVWYENKTSQGFTIKVEKSFTGTVSYSTFVYSDNDEVQAEQKSSTQRTGSITLSGEILTKEIAFDGEFPNNEYGLHMISNKNVNVWYTNKTTTGFTINIEETNGERVNIDWYADYSPAYKFQKHGTITFGGQITSAGTMPGLRFVNLPETFIIDDLKQGSILFSYINSNGVIDRANNNLNIQFSADRKSVREIKFQVQQENISYTDMRIFVKNSAGDWEEWINASDLSASTDIKVGEKIFLCRVEDTKYIEISFGNGIDFGIDPYGSEIFIFGLNTVGQDGNIPPNSLADNIILSRELLGDDNITIQFEEQFIQLLGLKSSIYFASNEITNPTYIYDNEGTRVDSNVLSIVQATPAFGGAYPENVEELRFNASTANLRQDRIVSLDDYSSFSMTAFNDIILKAKTLSYKEIEESGFLTTDMEKYFFNTIFLIVLPKYGNEITKKQKDYMLDVLNKKYKAMATVEHEIFAAKLIPIDVLVRFKPNKIGISSSVETNIKKVIQDYFDKSNHELGEELYHSDIISEITKDVIGIEYIELSMHKDEGNKLNSSDYDVDDVTTANETVAEVKRKKVLELLAKDPTIFNIVQPLFDVKDSTTNNRTWEFTSNIKMGDYEFPILGDITIELDGSK